MDQSTRDDTRGNRVRHGPHSWIAWGRPNRPGVVLVHGAGAHSGWWQHLAPAIAQRDSAVIAVDLAGHGDADWSPRYSLTKWADQVAAATHAASMAGRPVLVGHSLGGLVALRAAKTNPRAWGGLVIVDSLVGVNLAQYTPDVSAHWFASAEDAAARFRLMPPQDDVPAFVLHSIAHDSVVQDAHGWRWKTDPEVFRSLRADDPREDMEDISAQLKGRVRYIRGGSSAVITDSIFEGVRSQLPCGATYTIDGAGHHLILSNPDAFLAILVGWLADSRPHRETATD